MATGLLRARPIFAPGRSVRAEVWRWKVRNFFAQGWREVPLEILLFVCGLLKRVVPGFNMPMHGRLHGRVIRGDGTVLELGHIGVHLILDAGKHYVALSFLGTTEPEAMNFHGYGTSNTAAAGGQTALLAEAAVVAGTYSPANNRPTGAQTTPATGQYKSVATFSPTGSGTLAIVEWGLHSSLVSTTTVTAIANVLLDRQVFATVSLVQGSDSLQTTYTLTIA